MKAKTLKLKYPKKPGALLDKPEVVDYIWHLEDVGELDKLPLPFLAYYVVGCRLTDEVNSGGFAQYLSNSSVQTLPYLERCVNALGNAELTVICAELLSAVSKDFDINDTEAIAEADYSDELETALSALDDRFYALDEKCNVEELAKKYYKDNLPEEKLIFELVKPPVTDRRRYFIYDKSGITNEEAAKAFMAFLAEFSDVKFEIVIEKWGDMFRINATDSTNSLDLAEIHAHFDDSSYAFGKNGSSDRCKILSFNLGGGIFKEIHVDSCDEENWVWRLTITESGFDKNESVDVVVRPEDVDVVKPEDGMLTGQVTAVTFKGVHYEIIVDIKGFKWMIQSTDYVAPDAKIGLYIEPEAIHIMKKSKYSGKFGDYSSFSDEIDQLSDVDTAEEF